MAISNINRGTAPDNGTGDDLRTGAKKINDNFTFIRDTKLDKGNYTGTAGDLFLAADSKETPSGAQAKADQAETNANAYTDNAVQGRKWKDAADLATTANIVLSGEQTIDGVLTSVSRVLVKNQTSAAENGLYTTDAGAWIRTTDADTGPELERATLKILGGTDNANKLYTCTSEAITLGTTDIVFAFVGDAVDHNSTTGKQGGAAGEHYHLTLAQLEKLNGLEAGATADMTGAEIKSLYEAQANTNALTDARRDKLDGIPESIEPAFAKETGFNKPFGTVAGTVAEGNDSRFASATEKATWNGKQDDLGFDPANIRLSNVAGDLSETEKADVRGKIGGASNADISGLDGRVTDLETTYDDLALTWSTGDSKVINVVDSSKVTAVYVNGDRLVKDDEWAVFSVTEIEISNTLNDQDKVVVERGRGGVVDAFKEGFYALDIDGFNGKEKFTFYSKRRDSRDLYVGFHVVHQYDMSEAVYADLWRIAGAGDFKYENGVMVDQTRTIMTGAESECAYNSGGDDFVGGYHGDELFTDIKFFADGVQITDLSVDIPLTACTEFSYRQKSTMHQPMKNGVVDANHTIEAIHHKITSFKKGLYTTFNRLIPQYNDVPISLWYHGISCIGKINGELVANDFLEYETVLGDDLEKLHQVGGRRYYSSHKTNGLSAYAESKLLRPENKDSGCEMFVWDRVNDTKYYRKFIPSDPIVAGDIWESEMTVKFDKL